MASPLLSPREKFRGELSQGTRPADSEWNVSTRLAKYNLIYGWAENNTPTKRDGLWPVEFERKYRMARITDGITPLVEKMPVVDHS